MNKELFLKNYKEVMINYLVDEISKKKKGDSRYMDSSGRFKEMTCPDNPEKKSRYCGCLRYMQSLGKSLDSAKKLCGYIRAHVKKSEYKILKLELENEILKSDNFDREFVKSLFDKTLLSISKNDELDEVDRMLISSWIVLRRF